MDFAQTFPFVQEIVQDKAHRRKQGAGVVTYVEGVGEEQRRIEPLIG
ncbi:MAG: hypothetical protein IJW55_04470 [Clostridia bacterium]|nr:hypothetical protein [Clostridia bacterium]